MVGMGETTTLLIWRTESLRTYTHAFRAHPDQDMENAIKRTCAALATHPRMFPLNNTRCINGGGRAGPSKNVDCELRFLAHTIPLGLREPLAVSFRHSA